MDSPDGSTRNAVDGGFILLLSILILSLRKDPIVSVPFGLMGAYFLYCGFALRRFFRKQYKKDQRYQHEITADISKDGVRVVTHLQILN
jgi:hypothetical protein